VKVFEPVAGEDLHGGAVDQRGCGVHLAHVRGREDIGTGPQNNLLGKLL